MRVTLCLPLLPLVLAVCSLGVLHCGGKNLGLDVTPNPDGGPPVIYPSCSGGGSLALPGDRPSSTTCVASPINVQGGGSLDAGCATVADCPTTGVEPPFIACLGGKCSTDQCMTDSDCPSGRACACAREFGANSDRTNSCIPSQCRIDADCGREVGLCSPGYTTCGTFLGYYCHTAADACTTDADCCDKGAPACDYVPMLGHFACHSVTGCPPG
jgi:hypothetical protein